MQLKKIRYGVTLLPLGFALIAAATYGQGSKKSETSENRAVQTTIETTENAAAPAEVTINGKQVDVPANGTATVKTDGSETTVQASTSSSPTKSTADNSDDGSGNVNVSITTNNSNTNGNGSSFTHISSFSSTQTGSNSSSNVQVHTNGVGKVTVSH